MVLGSQHGSLTARPTKNGGTGRLYTFLLGASVTFQGQVVKLLGGNQLGKKRFSPTVDGLEIQLMSCGVYTPENLTN